MSGSNVHKGHRERMRIRFAENGFENYRPHEVLEQVLFFVIPRANTNETAHLLIEKFGSLSGVLNAPAGELMQVHGIGKRAAEYIASIRTKFASGLVDFYREQGVFGVYELALLADLTLPGTESRFLVAVFDESQKFTKIEFANTVLNPDGTVSAEKTAMRIAEIAGSFLCAAVTADGAFLEEETAETLHRTVNGMGCPLKQLLLTEDGALYSLI